ncbi:hypothetical protein AC578_10536 [Pseudocercospora eumusae]|uniref:SnoaL-like domain-containing protein n=1 Tax=Pseudocercospora eumusae TaxID=321146 RepID=A0A139H5X3_9PEZI|nr:hypothetical protein AC578_10536 [Pseudocercospora eumusae]
MAYDGRSSPPTPLTNAELDAMPAEMQLQTLLRLFVDAVNRRDLDPNLLVWTRVSEDFVGKIDPRLSSSNGPGGLREMYAEAFKENPRMKIGLTELVPCVDEKKGIATLFWTGTGKGFYDDVTIWSTGTVGFRRIEGQWFIKTFEGARGLKDLAS